MYNYRPITTAPVMSKVFEQLLYDQIINYFENNSHFCNCQYGFRKNRSTIDVVMSLVKDCLDGLQNRKFVSSKFYAFIRAFDTVSHILVENHIFMILI